ncbi:MAG: hypothetical protein KI791_17625 [Cyclobacteriaceae bacterium]|nr:hypothetical protein [Cyclobacteriaceae bacterium SS2]
MDKEDYYIRLLDKVDYLNKRGDRLLLLLSVLISSYYLVDIEAITEISVMGITLSNLELTKMFIPLFTAYIGLLYITLESHRDEMITVVEELGQNIFNISGDDINNDRLQRIMRPYSLNLELIIYSKGFSKMALILALPTLFIRFLPYLFEFYAVKYLIENNWQGNVFSKCIIITTIWLVGIILAYQMRHIVSIFRKAKEKQVRSEE